MQAVIAAVKEDRAKRLASLLDDGIDANSRFNDTKVVRGSRDYTLLHWAARFDASKSAEVQPKLPRIPSFFDTVRTLQVLIKHNASLELDDASGKKPLHVCGQYGSAAVAEVL